MCLSEKNISGGIEEEKGDNSNPKFTADDLFAYIKSYMGTKVFQSLLQR